MEASELPGEEAPPREAAWVGGAGLPAVLEHLLGEGLSWSGGRGEWSEGPWLSQLGAVRLGKDGGLSPRGLAPERGSWRARLSFSRSSMIQLSSSGSWKLR